MRQLTKIKKKIRDKLSEDRISCKNDSVYVVSYLLGRQYQSDAEIGLDRLINKFRFCLFINFILQNIM